MSKPVAVTIKHISTTGLIVSLPDGHEGFIRERELGVDRQGNELTLSAFRIGQSVEAVLTGKGNKNRFELSIGRLAYDKWVAKNKHAFGQVTMIGSVTGLTEYGVFVELAPGVTGLLHNSRLPEWNEMKSADLFWPGDQIKVMVEGFDPIKRHLSLTMRGLQRWNDLEQKGMALALVDLPSQQNQTQSLFSQLVDQPALTILVIEDDPIQEHALVSWLRNTGQVVESAQSGEEAVTQYANLRPDVVLSDLHLPAINGIEAVRQLRVLWPESRFAIMTDWLTAEEYVGELGDLHGEGVDLILKPLLSSDLLKLLLGHMSQNVPKQQGSSPLHIPVRKVARTMRRTEREELDDVLTRLLARTKSSKVVIFEMDVDRRYIDVLEHRGSALLRLDQVTELIHSPVRDVAEQRRQIKAQTGQEVMYARFDHLRPLIGFKSCIGVPIPVRLHNRYALFLFFDTATIVTNSITSMVENTAAIVGLWLERHHLLRQSADLHRAALLGQLNRTLVHEVGGRIYPITLALEELQAICNEVRSNSENPAKFLDQAQATLSVLSDQAEALTRTFRSFSRMTRSGQEEIVILSDIIDDAIIMVKDSAKAANIRLISHPAPSLFFTRTQVTDLQQVLVNILQNAVQQIALLRPDLGGQIAIRLTQKRVGDEQRLVVLVEDDGPGIHRRLWERIFELDYTTRTEGSGLGLYVSRRLIEDQGGCIQVLESYLLWGTIFTIELPHRV